MERSGSYARYYEFTLSERREVTLHLQSGTAPYLYLRSGAEQRSGRAIDYDDDGGRGRAPASGVRWSLAPAPLRPPPSIPERGTSP